MQRGIATFTLDTGTCPRWLFQRMVKLGREMSRVLVLVAEVIYGAGPSYEVPARCSFAHGGKDATPHPVDRLTYDKTIGILAEAVKRSWLSPYDNDRAIKRIGAFEVGSEIVRWDDTACTSTVQK